MIYLFDQMQSLDPVLIEKMFCALPMWRQKQADKFRIPIDRNLSVISYMLLIAGLREEYQIHSLPRFSYLTHGKPFLPDYPNIYFSITHCCMGAACAVFDHPVGLDMQNVAPYSCGLAEYIFSAKEQTMLKQSENPNAEFARLWSRREAYAKLTGKGVYHDLHSLNDAIISTQCHLRTIQTPNYCLTLAEYYEHSEPSSNSSF